MGRPVTGLTVFGSNTSGTTTQLDTNFTLITNTVNDYNSYSNYLVDTGSVNALVASLPASALGPLSDGLIVQVRVANTNTSAPTFAFNGGAPVSIVQLNGTTVTAGMICAGAIVQMQYSTTSARWILQTPFVSGGNANSNSNGTVQLGNANQVAFYVNAGCTVSGVDQILSTNLPNSNVTAGNYGSASSFPVLTVDAKGRITAAANANVTANVTVGDATGTTLFTGVSGTTLTGTAAGGLLIKTLAQNNNGGIGGSTQILGGHGGNAAQGGGASMKAGNGGANSGTGGRVDIEGGNATASTALGGDVFITSGGGGATGQSGEVRIDSANAGTTKGSVNIGINYARIVALGNLSAGGVVKISSESLVDQASRPIWSNTDPTINTGFGTSPSITGTNTAAFKVTVGSAPGSTGVINLFGVVNGWSCSVTNITSGATLVCAKSAGNTTAITVTSYSRANGNVTNFNASDVLEFICWGY